MKDEIKAIEKQNNLNLSEEAGVAALLMQLESQSLSDQEQYITFNYWKKATYALCQAVIPNHMNSLQH